MKLENATIIENKPVAEGVYSLRLSMDGGGCSPGQFLNLYPKESSTLLPRPMSICDYENGTLRILYQVVGKGTREFSGMKKGDTIKTLCPLGKGFDIPQGSGCHVLAAGGIGAPPLLMLAKQLKGEIHVFLGFRSQPVLVEEFKEITPYVYVATEDGSVGFKGNVIRQMEQKQVQGDYYYACGPKPMLAAFCGYLEEKGREGQVSLESHMACGIGACVGCAVKIMQNGKAVYLKTCKDGPVFSSKAVVWE